MNQVFGVLYVLLAVFGGLMAYRLMQDYQTDLEVAGRVGAVEYRFLLLLNQQIQRAQTFILLCGLVLVLGLVAILVVERLDFYLLGVGLIGPIVLDWLIVRALRENRGIRRKE